MNGVTLSWMVEVLLISWNAISGHAPVPPGVANKANFGGKRPPLPAALVATLIVWGGLSMLSSWQKATTVATLLGVGLNIATFLYPYSTGNTSAQLSGQNLGTLFPGSIWSSTKPTTSTTKTATTTGVTT